MRPRLPPGRSRARDGRRSVLIVSASIGGGHDGVAAELARRVADYGMQAECIDFLDQLPIGIGRVGRYAYRESLRRFPGTYDAAYRMSLNRHWLWRAIVLALSALTRRRLSRRVRATAPCAIVSVYPLSSLVLGRMRAKGWLAVPTLTYLTDFSAHPLWIHPAIDLHLAISDAALESAHAQGATAGALVRPLVALGFTDAAKRADRAVERRALGLEPGDTAALIVSGSWGVGGLTGAVAAIRDIAGIRIVCVCGRNERLRTELEQQGIAIVVGWTDRMAAIMSACDVLIENAGGLTCMEASAIGLPVVTFDPIAGHGRHNAELMAASGVVHYAHTATDLRSIVISLAAHSSPPPAAAAMHGRVEASEYVASLARPVTRRTRLTREPVLRRALVNVTAIGVAFYLAATVVFAAGAAHGFGVDNTGEATTLPTVVGVRLRADQLADPNVRLSLQEGTIVAVVDQSTACNAGDLRGVALASTGEGVSHRLAWVSAHDDVEEAPTHIRACTGTTPAWFVALRRPNAFDWVVAHYTSGQRILRPITIGVGSDLTILRPHRLYVVDATAETSQSASDVIARLARLRAEQRVVTLAVST